MDHPQAEAQPQQNRGRGRARKNPIQPSANAKGTADPPNVPSVTSKFSKQSNSKWGRGRPRGTAPHPASVAEEIVAGAIALPSDFDEEGSQGRPIRTIRYVSKDYKGTFSGLRNEDKISYWTLQMERLQGDPDEIGFLTNSDEEMDDSTDVEDGGFKGAEQRRKKAAKERAIQDIYLADLIRAHAQRKRNPHQQSARQETEERQPRLDHDELIGVPEKLWRYCTDITYRVLKNTVEAIEMEKAEEQRRKTEELQCDSVWERASRHQEGLTGIISQ